MEITFLEKNTDFMVGNKPYGLSSHASPGDPGEDLVSLIKKQDLMDGQALAPITRLDRQASGLILLSDNPEFIDKVQLKIKTYQCLAFGKAPEKGVIDTSITTKKFGKKKASQDALSKYKKIAGTEKYSWLEVTIVTGRHHQIRKHLRSIGHPIIGDFRHGYNDKNLEMQTAYGQTVRLCLHCTRLKFFYAGKMFEYALDFPIEILGIKDFIKL